MYIKLLFLLLDTKIKIEFSKYNIHMGRNAKINDFNKLLGIK